MRRPAPGSVPRLFSFVNQRDSCAPHARLIARTCLQETDVARIAGVNIPTQKRVADRASVHPWHRPEVRDGDLQARRHPGRAPRQPADRRRGAADPRSDRPRLRRRGRSSPRSRDEHQAPDGPRLLSRPASPQGSAGSRPAHAHQRAHAQGPGEADRRQEEGAKAAGFNRLRRLARPGFSGAAPAQQYDRPGSGHQELRRHGERAGSGRAPRCGAARRRTSRRASPT